MDGYVNQLYQFTSNIATKMKRKFSYFSLVVYTIISNSCPVFLEKIINHPDSTNDLNQSSRFSDSFAQCLKDKIYGTFECINVGSLSVLKLLDDKDNLDFDGVQLVKSDRQARDHLEFDYDPKEFSNVIKAASKLMERRNLQWDLSMIYPGLMMKVGPTLNGNGLLEFEMDEQIIGYSHNRQIGTGRVLVKNLVLPFLLGFKFSLSSLIPLLFGVLLLITKKALFLTKVALIMSGILGWNAFASSSNYGMSSSEFSPSISHGYNHFGLNNHHHHHHGFDHNVLYEHYPYRGPFRTPYSKVGYNEHVIRELVNVYEPNRDSNKITQPPKNDKKFIWNNSNSRK